MAERRMFAKTIITSDAFMDMPIGARLLYFYLMSAADDDGFINNPKSVMRQVGCANDDMNALISRNFILIFDDGVMVIKHWRIHNYIQKDRYKATNYIEHYRSLGFDENKAYTTEKTACIQNVSNVDTQDRLGKDSLDQDSLEKDENMTISEKKQKYGEYSHVKLTDNEYQKLVEEYTEETTQLFIKTLDDYCEMTGKKYKNSYLAIKKWVIQAVLENKRNDNTVIIGKTSNKFMEALLKKTQEAI